MKSGLITGLYSNNISGLQSINLRKRKPKQGFITEWKTTTPGETITLPLSTDGGIVHNFVVKWGDGSSSIITSAADPNRVHTYAAAGTYNVEIIGRSDHWKFNNGGDKLKIKKIKNWGSRGVFDGFTSFLYAFHGCSNLVITATDHVVALVGKDVINFYAAFASCSGLTSFPLINTSSGTNFGWTWSSCSGLLSFPLINTSSGTNFYGTWKYCSGLLSFPLINTSSGTSFRETYQNCSGLLSFPLINTSSGITFDRAWSSCSGLNDYNFPTLNMGALLYGNGCFTNVTLSTISYSDLLISIENLNANNNITFSGGNSKYNTAGATARAALIADHTWTITDGGAA